MTKKILVLGVTGSFGSGKTTVALMLKKLGAICIDADRIYHQLIKPQSPLYRMIVSAFGREILKKNKCIDGKKLGQIVFNQPRARKRLSQLTHPIIIRRLRNILSKLKQIKGPKVLVIDAPLLIEAGLINIVDKLLVVEACRKKQIARCAKQRGLSEAEIISRIEAQLPLWQKLRLADYVIDNNGTLEQTRNQVKNIWKEVQLKVKGKR